MFTLFNKSKDQLLKDWAQQDREQFQSQEIKTQLQRAFIKNDMLAYTEALVLIAKVKFEGIVGVSEGMMTFKNGLLVNFTSN